MTSSDRWQDRVIMDISSALLQFYGEGVPLGETGARVRQLIGEHRRALRAIDAAVKDGVVPPAPGRARITLPDGQVYEVEVHRGGIQ